MKRRSENQEIIDLIMKKQQDNLITGRDVSNFFDDLYGDLIQALLEGEMDDFIGYKKGEHCPKENDNRRNGYSSKGKKVKTKSGEIEVDMPRDRKGEFEPKIIEKRQRVLEGLDEKVIAMYSRGMTLTDIKEMIKEIYKIELSNQTISTLTESVSNKITEWQKRPLKECYPFVYVDCLYCYVKEDLVSVKKAVYVMLGIDTEGKKEVIGIWIDKTESATFWNEIFEEIKSRGVEDIFFVSMDGLKGLPEAIEKIYPKTITQRCVVHLVRNIYGILNKKEAGETVKDFKKVYTAPTKESAEIEYAEFRKKYSENKRLIKKTDEYIEYIYPLFEYPEEIRKIIYTTNPIESLNSALRKVTKGKGSFINEMALMKVLYLRVENLEKKWCQGSRNWKTVQNQLSIIFSDRYSKYI